MDPGQAAGGTDEVIRLDPSESAAPKRLPIGRYRVSGEARVTTGERFYAARQRIDFHPYQIAAAAGNPGLEPQLVIEVQCRKTSTGTTSCASTTTKVAAIFEGDGSAAGRRRRNPTPPATRSL
jgi:hypothetical protein